MNNLKPLVWNKSSKSWTAYGAGISYSITEFDGVATVSWHNMVKSAKDLPFSSDKKTLLSYSEALDFVENEHYPHFMSEFVKPSPTWIDISERLPEKSGRYMVVHQTTKPVKNKSTPVDIDSYDENEKSWSFFRLGIMQEVTHWMPLPELPISKESDCD